MNKKETNYLIVILNVIAEISIYIILGGLPEFLQKSMMIKDGIRGINI